MPPTSASSSSPAPSAFSTSAAGTCPDGSSGYPTSTSRHPTPSPPSARDRPATGQASAGLQPTPVRKACGCSTKDRLGRLGRPKAKAQNNCSTRHRLHVGQPRLCALFVVLAVVCDLEGGEGGTSGPRRCEVAVLPCG